MLTSLKITGFRAFESLTIEDLGRVNLFVGENGSGKTAVLEAVELLVKGAQKTILVGQLVSRKEFLYRKGDKGDSSFLDVCHLFHGHDMQKNPSFEITDPSNENLFVKCGPLDSTGWSIMISDLNQERIGNEEISTGLKLEGSDGESSIPVTYDGGISKHQPISFHPKHASGHGKPHFARFPASGRGDLAQMWDDISLSPIEEPVIKAAKIVDSRVQTIRTLQNGEVVVKLDDEERRQPLGTLGEGVSQMLVIALTVADSEGSTALIDEIDTGLHYSVMEKMWRMVIETVRRLDVQVFATTHSQDCVRALGWLYKDDPDLVSDVRLHRIDKGRDRTTVLSARQLMIAERQELEVR